MLTIKNLTINKLKNPQEFEEFKQMVLDFMRLDNIDEGRDLYEKLQREVPYEKVKELPAEYEEYIKILKLVILSTLSDKDAVNAIENELVYAFKKGIDIVSKLDSLYILFADDYNDFQLHKSLARALGTNKETIGTKKILIKGEDDLVRPTVENWIRDFSSSLDSGKSANYIDEAEYFSKNININKLTKDEVEILKKVIRLYNYLKNPIKINNRVKDTGHTINKDIDIINKDNTENQNIGTPMERLKKKYNTYRRSRWNILKLEDEILMQTKGDNESIKKELSLAARENNTEKLVACIKILGRQNSLLDSLRQSPSWQHSLKEYIITKYAPQAEPEEISYVTERLNENYKNPAVISEFLQYLFIEKLKMSENEAALTAIEIGQLLGGEFELIAYGDQETGNFIFSKNKILNNQLVMEK